MAAEDPHGSGDDCLPTELLRCRDPELKCKMAESPESAIFLERMRDPEGDTQSVHSHGPSDVMMCVQGQAGRVLPYLAAVMTLLL